MTYSKDPGLLRFANTPIPDDPQLDPRIPFVEGVISYAGSGPNSRTSQIFIAYGTVSTLGQSPWETPIGIVTEGMSNTIQKLYAEYGDMPPWGKGPVQQKIRNQGRVYIEKEFPLLDHFLECTVDKNDGTVENPALSSEIETVDTTTTAHKLKDMNVNKLEDSTLIVTVVCLSFFVVIIYFLCIRRFRGAHLQKAE